MRNTLYFSLIVGVVIQFSLTINLPDTIANHFDSSGGASGWTSRGHYLLITLITLAGNSLLFHLFDTFFDKLPNHLISFPYKKYWLTPIRKKEGIRRMVRWTDTLGVGINIFLILTYVLVYFANNASPPQLNNTWFTWLLALFTVFIISWIILIYRVFKPPLDC